MITKMLIAYSLRSRDHSAAGRQAHTMDICKWKVQKFSLNTEKQVVAWKQS